MIMKSRKDMALGEFPKSRFRGWSVASRDCVLKWSSCCDKQSYLKFILKSEINLYQLITSYSPEQEKVFLEVKECVCVRGGGGNDGERRMKLKKCNCIYGKCHFLLDCIRIGSLFFFLINVSSFHPSAQLLSSFKNIILR